MCCKINIKNHFINIDILTVSIMFVCETCVMVIDSVLHKEALICKKHYANL